MAFCGQCGQSVNEQARFCTSCGQPLAGPAVAAPATSTVPVSSPEQAPAMPTIPTTPSTPAESAAPASTAWSAHTALSAPTPATVDLGSLWRRHGEVILRTTIGIVLLLLSFGLEWTTAGTTADQLFPLLAVIAAMGACLVDLVLRPEITGHTFDDSQRQLFRLLLVAPLGAAILWAVIAIFANDQGLSFGIPVALVGAIVGAMGTRPGAGTAGTGWTTAGIWLLWTAALLLVVAAVVILISAADIAQFAGGQFWLIVIATLMPLFWLAGIAIHLAMRAAFAEPRTVALILWLAATIGSWFVVSRFLVGPQLSLALDQTGSAGAFALTIGGMGLFVAGIACMLGPSRTQLVRGAPAWVWIEASRTGLRLTMSAHLLMVGMIAFLLIATSSNSFGSPDRGAPIWLLVLHILGAAAAATATSTLHRDPRLGRTQVFVYAAVFSIAHWITYATADSQNVASFTVHDALTMFGPLALALLLVLSSSVRDELGAPRVPAALRGTPVQQASSPQQR